MRTSEILENAAFAAMIPGIWTQKAYAKNDKNTQVNALDPGACKFCVLGMLQAVINAEEGRFNKDYLTARRALKKQVGLFIVDWNDGVVKNQKHVAKALWLAARDMELIGN